ncbi:hypothetical protein [Kitasatospora sp. NPDC059571]|uniref:hypothetical protein n=1 Tax=Kitasatospora sp. NPDC059571 TaxID=3346871 RepID=UPI0036AF8C1F
MTFPREYGRQPVRHRLRSRSGGRARRVTALGIPLGAILTITVLIGVSSAATAPGPASPDRAGTGAGPNPGCTLVVPPAPLTAKGLATPYRLTATDPRRGPCHESNLAQAAFVQATVLDPATGALSVYNPLVTDQRRGPAAPPVVPVLPRNAVVGIWFGFNGDVLTLKGAPAGAGCVNGSPGQPFGQFAYCNAPAFFAAADTARRAGRLTVPSPGTARDGKPCPTTRDFGLVDQDQSDNVTTEYLVTGNGATAQRTAANARRLRATSLLNGSDNLLLTKFVDPALGCTPWTAPDLADPGHRATSLALDELQAAAHQAAPVAIVPLNDPMVRDHGRQSTAKTDLYRAGVGQPRVGRRADGDPKAYCDGLAGPGRQRIRLDRRFTAAAPSPVDGQNLFDFLTERLAASLTSLGCVRAAPAGGAASPAPSVSAHALTDPAPSASASAGTGTGPGPTASG